MLSREGSNDGEKGSSLCSSRHCRTMPGNVEDMLVSYRHKAVSLRINEVCGRVEQRTCPMSAGESV